MVENVNFNAPMPPAPNDDPWSTSFQFPPPNGQDTVSSTKDDQGRYVPTINGNNEQAIYTADGDFPTAYGILNNEDGQIYDIQVDPSTGQVRLAPNPFIGPQEPPYETLSSNFLASGAAGTFSQLNLFFGGQWLSINSNDDKNITVVDKTGTRSTVPIIGPDGKPTTFTDGSMQVTFSYLHTPGNSYALSWDMTNT